MKWFWSILSLIILVIVVLLVLFFTNTAYFMSTILSSRLGMKISIEQAHVSMNEVQMQDFKVLNPPGMSDPVALDIGNIEIVAPLTNYLRHITEIKHVLIEDIVFRLEFPKAGGTSNWKILTSSKKSTISSEEPSSNQPPQSPADRAMSTSEDKKGYAIIELLEIRNITIEVIVAGKKTRVETMKDIVLTDVKTTNEDISRRITQIVLYHLLFNVRNLIDFPINLGNDAANKIFESIDFFNPFKKRK